MVVSEDLRGLGPEEGAPVYYDWRAPSIVPQLLPWAGILALLALRPNRRGSAWWIWVPLGLMGALASAPALLGDLPSSEIEDLLGLFFALMFGVAAVWLVAGYLTWTHRMLTLLGMLVAQAVCSVLVYMIGHGLEGVRGQTIAIIIALGAGALVLTTALTLTGLVCRGRYGWLRLSLWLVVTLGVLCLLVTAPFFIIAVISSGGNVPLLAVFPVVGVETGIAFGALLPFLVLSFANGFYRERLKGLLHLGQRTPPPTIKGPVEGAVTAASV